MTDAVLVGANLAALVAAAELGAAGRQVALLTDGRPVGGHFRGVLADGIAFDVGMVSLERPTAAAGAEPDALDYRPDRRYDWTRFAGQVDRWQAGHAELRRVPTPEVLVDGRRFPDHLMSDRLDVLAELGRPPEHPLPRTDPGHAAAKLAGPAYDTLTYREAAAGNHGGQVQGRLVDPFLDKVLGAAADHLLARYHRAAWVPLYWPETVAAACRGEVTPVLEHPFWTTAAGRVGALVGDLEETLAGMPSVSVDTSPVLALSGAGRSRQVRTTAGLWEHPAPVLGLPAARTTSLLQLPPGEDQPAVGVAVLCCLVRADAVGDPASCVLVVDPDVLAYRITDQDAMAGRDVAWRRVTVEAGAAAGAVPTTDLGRRLVEDLVRVLGLPAARVEPDGGGHPDVRVLRLVQAPGALPVPTREGVAADRRLRDSVEEALPGVLPTGVLLGTGLNSLADQVVQGLAVARRFG